MILTLWLGLWVASPWLVPPLARSLLPGGWSLASANLDRPGLTGMRLESGELLGLLAGHRVIVELKGVTLRYAGPQLHAETVRISLIPGDAEISREPFRPADLTLPRLVLPTLEATVDIDTLAVRYGEGDSALTGSLENLHLAGEAAAVRLAADLEPNAYVREASRFTLDWGSRRFFLEWATASRPQAPSLRVEQAIREGATPWVDGQVQVDLDLASLNPRQLTPLADALGLGVPLDAKGQVFGLVTFEGIESLVPEQVDLVLEGVNLRTSGTVIELDLVAAIERGDPGPVARITSLAAHSDGPLPRINEALGALGESLPLEGLDAGGPFSLRASAPLQTEAPLVLHLSRAGDRLVSLDGSLRLDVALQADTIVSATLPEITWIEADGASRSSARQLDLRLRRDNTLLYRMDDATVGFSAAEFHLTGDLASNDGAIDFRGRLDAGEFRDFTVSHPAATARFGTLGLAGPLEVEAEHLHFAGALGGTGLVVAPADELAANSLVTADSLAFDLVGEGVGAMKLSGSGSINGIALPDLGVNLDGITVDIGRLDVPAMNGQLSALTQGMEVALTTSTTRGLDLELNGELLEGQFLAGEGSLLLGFTGELPFRYEADLRAPTLEARLTEARLGAQALPAAARALALSLPDALGFRDGALVLNGNIRYGEGAVDGNVKVKGEALVLGLGESRFEGLDFTTEIDLADVISGRGPLALKLANLAAGLDLTSLTTSLEFAGADFGLLSLDARLLGGVMRTPGLKLAGGQLQGTTIEWIGFDLGELLSFADVTGLSGTGTLDATIPVVNDGGGPAVEAGRFAARGPGVLRYDSGVPATNIGLQALENFEYEQLEGELNYANDGAYTIALDLLGRNPDLYGGHPIRFRLNLGGEMPALFRSLFITGDFDKAIIERLRAGETALPESDGTPP